MGEFLKGWRRDVGTVALLIACSSHFGFCFFLQNCSAVRKGDPTVSRGSNARYSGLAAGPLLNCVVMPKGLVPLRSGNMMPNTVRFHRVLRTTPEKLYRAFLDPDALAKWLPPNGFTGKVHEMDARVGGGYRMSFTNFGSGKSHSFGAKYTELKPGERICYTNRFDDPNLPGEMGSQSL